MVGIILGKEEHVEEWRPIPYFDGYEISNYGNIYSVHKRRLLRPSVTQYGHLKISLISSETGLRHTVMMSRLVAEAFVSRPDPSCDQVMVLNGFQRDVRSENLAWRPESFVWRYTHQLKIGQPRYYKDAEVANISTGKIYRSIVEAGMSEGLLFEDIWRSTYQGTNVYPYNHVFEIFQ